MEKRIEKYGNQKRYLKHLTKYNFTIIKYTGVFRWDD